MHLIHVGDLDPAPVLAAIARHEADFGAATWRQDAAGSAHRDTETLYLRMPPEITAESVFHGLETSDTALMAEPAFAGALDALSFIVAGEIARAMIVRLRPGGCIAPHVDEGTYADSTERYHWALSTNPGCVMIVEDEEDELAHMAAGTIWYFDKHARHSAQNGDTPRLHLIFDIWTVD